MVARTVLVVDDTAMLRKLIATVLERAGYAVLIAESGEAALATFVAAPAPVDMVITDWRMQGMNGLELIGALRELAPTLPIIFTSGSEPPRLDGATSFGFLRKPFTPTELIELVSTTLAAAGR
ncbi:MAG: response regulator [Kofleriaceae bacterium]